MITLTDEQATALISFLSGTELFLRGIEISAKDLEQQRESIESTCAHWRHRLLTKLDQPTSG